MNASLATESAEDHPITASYKWTRDEFVIAQQSHAALQLRPWLRRAFLGLVLFVVTAALLIMVTQPLAAEPMPRVLIVFSSCFLLSGSGLLAPWNLKRRWKRGKFREGDVFYRFTPDAIMIEDRFTTATIKWKAFVAIVEAQRGFLFYPQSNIFRWIPFHAFEDAEDVERVREFIVRSEVPFKGLNAPRGG